ncbi:28S ribosomal protein S35-like 1 [Homarus americanus]|uniref:28S ribosomal protein S35-like 1 n=1 Tax=Homarus americanus TaxID=6706 RepID=A0A8J5KFG5_HOMAM|nr:28S ribosomal protein S35-like 1 [Homarus americanus]
MTVKVGSGHLLHFTFFFLLILTTLLLDKFGQLFLSQLFPSMTQELLLHLFLLNVLEPLTSHLTGKLNNVLHILIDCGEARKVSLKSLDLDDHGRDKLLRLVKDRYDAATDCLTIVADRCPLSQQNYDYCQYLLTVLYNESMVSTGYENLNYSLIPDYPPLLTLLWVPCQVSLSNNTVVKTEPWEHEKEVADRERYLWEGSPSQARFQTIISAKEDCTPEEVIKDYEQVVTDLHNEGEDEPTLSRYRESVLKVVGLA